MIKNKEVRKKTRSRECERKTEQRMSGSGGGGVDKSRVSMLCENPLMDVEEMELFAAQKAVCWWWWWWWWTQAFGGGSLFCLRDRPTAVGVKFR